MPTIFPRMGKIVGNEQEQSNCRVSPWNRVVTRFSGNSFVEIDRRQVDNNGESWFHNESVQGLTFSSDGKLLYQGEVLLPEIPVSYVNNGDITYAQRLIISDPSPSSRLTS